MTAQDYVELFSKVDAVLVRAQGVEGDDQFCEWEKAHSHELHGDDIRLNFATFSLTIERDQIGRQQKAGDHLEFIDCYGDPVEIRLFSLAHITVVEGRVIV